MESGWSIFQRTTLLKAKECTGNARDDGTKKAPINDQRQEIKHVTNAPVQNAGSWRDAHVDY